MKICGFLNGLGREYDPISTVIQSSMSRLPTPSFTDVVYEIKGYDARLQSYDATTVTLNLAFHTEEAPTQIVFQTSNTKYRGMGSYNSIFGSNRGRGGFSSRGCGFHQESATSGPPQQSNNANQKPTCQICGIIGHIVLKCWNRFDHNYQSEDAPQAIAAFQVSDNSGREWYPDSGASAHVTSSPAALHNVAPYNGLESIMVADGNYLPITHVGSTNLSVTTCSVPLKDVLVCPSVKKPLLYVSKFCEDYLCGVFFDANKIYILDLQIQKVITKGPRREGLYVLENQNYKTFYSTRQRPQNTPSGIIALIMLVHKFSNTFTTTRLFQ